MSRLAVAEIASRMAKLEEDISVLDKICPTDTFSVVEEVE